MDSLALSEIWRTSHRGRVPSLKGLGDDKRAYPEFRLRSTLGYDCAALRAAAAVSCRFSVVSGE